MNDNSQEIGLTARSIRDDILEVGQELSKEGIDLHQFFIDAADPSVTFKDLSFAIKMNNYEAIIIGGGMRKMDAHLIIFENLLNLLLHERQTFKIGLNLYPKNTYATCKRLLSDLLVSDKK